MAEETTYVPLHDGNNNGWGNGWSAGLGGLLGALFGNGWNGNGWGGNGNANAQMNASTQSQIQQLSDLVTSNHNQDMTQGSIGGVMGAINGGFANVSQDLCGIKSAVNEQGAASRLQNCEQTNTILLGNQALQNAVTNGFTALGYQLSSGLCDAKQNSTTNTQRIIDTLTNHWQIESQSIISQLRDELTTEKQTNALIAALKTTSTTSTGG